MFYKITMLVRPKYNHRRSVEEQDLEFHSTVDGSGFLAHEITRGTVVVEEYKAEEIWKDETVA